MRSIRLNRLLLALTLALAWLAQLVLANLRRVPQALAVVRGRASFLSGALEWLTSGMTYPSLPRRAL